MKRFYDPARTNFVFLVPIAMIAMSGDPMTPEDIRKEIVGNTVVVELEEGTAYARSVSGGVIHGLHPKHGRITGKLEISEEGEACVSWPKPYDVKNCSKVVKGETEGTYGWAGKELKVVAGNPKGLGG